MIGVGTRTLIVVFALTTWVVFARVVRGTLLPLREASFVLAARCAGCKDTRLLLRHVLPVAVPVASSVAIIEVGRLMIVEAGLSFLGFGVQPPDVTWGLILEEGRQYLGVGTWLIAFPGLGISLTVLAMVLFGTWVRKVTDPFRRDVAERP
jgi:peptide/nickel transport system permease protein